MITIFLILAMLINGETGALLLSLLAVSNQELNEMYLQDKFFNMQFRNVNEEPKKTAQ